MTDPGRSGGEGTGWSLPNGEKPDDLRWYATHEALSRHSIFDVLQWLADTMETHTLLDPVTARDTIARAREAAATYEAHHAAAVHAPIGDPLRKVHSALGDLTHEVLGLLAALASQERGA